MQSRFFLGLDIDVEDEPTVRAVSDLALEYLGTAPVRSRDGSPRRLRMYVLASDHAPISKMRLAWRTAPDAPVQAVELLGAGQQYVIEGEHPKGGRYRWDEQPGAYDLTPVTLEWLEQFFAAVRAHIEAQGWEVASTTVSGSSTGARKSLDDPSLWAPSPQHVLDALAVWRPPHMDHDAYVQAIAAIKAALGPEREQYFPEVLEWSPGVRSTEADEARKRWDSVHDSALGWEFIAGHARGCGYSGSADPDFATEVPADAMPETARDRMIKNTVYVESQNFYFDTEDGALRSPQAFRSKYVEVAPFGSSGRHTADAVFQNAPDARKVVTVAVKPGAPVLTEAKSESGMAVSAVNLWRPSSVKPNLQATAATVAPWLDLVNKLFGAEEAPERDHFLNWQAFVLQNPGKKIGHAPVLIGVQGAGKDTVLRPLFEALGTHNVATIDSDMLAGPWNFYLKSMLIYVQEASKRQADFYNRIKPYISAQKTLLPVNEKHMRQWFVENFQNWIVTTNFDDALRLEEGDRRFWVHRVLIEEPPDERYFTNLHQWFEAGGIEAVYGWLIQRDISSFNPMATPPMTAAKRAMIEASLPPGVRWVLDQFRDGGAFDGRTIITVSEVAHRARQDFHAPEATDKHVLAALKAMGFKSARRVRIGRDTPQLWVRDPAALLVQLPPDKLREHYLAQTQRSEAVA